MHVRLRPPRRPRPTTALILALFWAVPSKPTWAQLRVSEPMTRGTFVQLQTFMTANNDLPEMQELLRLNPSLSAIPQMDVDRLSPNDLRMLGLLNAHLPDLTPQPEHIPFTIAQIFNAHHFAQSHVIDEINDRAIEALTGALTHPNRADARHILRQFAVEVGTYSFYGEPARERAAALAARLQAPGILAAAYDLARSLRLEVRDDAVGKRAVVWADHGDDSSAFVQARSQLLRGRKVNTTRRITHIDAAMLAAMRADPAPSASFLIELHRLQSLLHPFYYTDLTDEELEGIGLWQHRSQNQFVLRQQGLSAAQADEYIALMTRSPDIPFTFEEHIRLHEFRLLRFFYYFTDITFAEIRELARLCAIHDIEMEMLVRTGKMYQIARGETSRMLALSFLALGAPMDEAHQLIASLGLVRAVDEVKRRQEMFTTSHPSFRARTPLAHDYKLVVIDLK